MGSVASSLFGGTSADEIDLGQRFTTGRGSQLRRGRLTIPQELFAPREEALAGIREIIPSISNIRSQFRESIRAPTEALATARGDVRDVLGRLRSNVNPFIQARVAPLERRLEAGRAATERGLARRSVFGTPAIDALTRQDIEGEQALGEARAIATQEALGAELGALAQETSIAGQELGAAEAARAAEVDLDRTLQSLNLNLADIAQGDVALELQQLGLSVESILGLMGQHLQRAGLEDQSRQFALQGIGNAIGGFLGF